MAVLDFVCWPNGRCEEIETAATRAARARSVRVRAVVSFGQSFLGLVRVRKSWAAERACADWEVPFILGGKTAISADLRC